MASFITVESLAGKPVEFHGNNLVPINQVWQLKLPWPHGGLIWNRPASVVVTDANQQETVIPIQDVTRQAVWFFMGLSFTSLLLAIFAGRRGHEEEN